MPPVDPLSLSFIFQGIYYFKIISSQGCNVLNTDLGSRYLVSQYCLVFLKAVIKRVECVNHSFNVFKLR